MLENSTEIENIANNTNNTNNTNTNNINTNNTNTNNINNSNINIENDQINIKPSYIELEKMKKIIENLDKIHHIEIGKILKKNKIKLTENNNGIFINLNSISSNIIDEIDNYVNFVKSQEYIINIDESQKNNLENIYFKNNKEINSKTLTNKKIIDNVSQEL